MTDSLRLLCRESPDNMTRILDALQELVLLVDDRLRVTAVNAAAAAFFGLPPDRAAAGPALCDLFGPGACPADCARETLETGRPITDYQTEVALPDGRRFDVLVRTVPLRAPAGDRPGGVALLLRDVTEITSLRKEIAGRAGLLGIVGKNRRMQELYRLIEDVAPTDATVLVRGETGTGKELVARALHRLSRRADGPFVTVNCSALSETLLESELFGHVRGAFTGAVADRRGRFEEARGGTLFLDEIGDVSPVVQVKLLRVLQERVVERVGDNTPRPVDVRIITATHRDLEELVTLGRIRSDFYYRIRVVTLELPPLRERRDDIPLLLEHFLRRHGLGLEAVTPEAMRLLLDHSWPGNIRELENVVEHAVILGRGGPIAPRHLPPELRQADAEAPASRRRRVPPHSPQEKRLIEEALERWHGHRGRAAAELGIDRTTLWRKMREYGLLPATRRRRGGRHGG